MSFLLAPARVELGKEFNIRLDMVNVAKNNATLVQIKDMIPVQFKIVSSKPLLYVNQGFVDLQKKQVSPFRNEEITLLVQATATGSFTLQPEIVFIDELGEIKTTRSKPITIFVEPASQNLSDGNPVRATRIPTGIPELDNVLLGGIPEGYAIVLTTPVSDERELILQRFLKVGAEKGETTLCVSTEPRDSNFLTEKHRGNFHLFLCNPRADLHSKQMSNIHNIRSIENLTEIDIALTKAFRCLNQSQIGARRACTEIVSDVLLHHHAIITRKWLSSFIPDLKTHGFTVLSVVNPEMHPTEEVQAILRLFDGEIKVMEKETEKGVEKILTIRRLYNQPYREKTIVLGKEKLA